MIKKTVLASFLFVAMAACSTKDVMTNEEVAAAPPPSGDTATPMTVAANTATTESSVSSDTARTASSGEIANLGAASAGRGR